MISFIILLFSPLVFSFDLCTLFPNLKICLNKNDDSQTTPIEISCYGHGHIEKNMTCICRSEWQGTHCEQEKIVNQKIYSSYNESQFYDWREMHTRRRLSDLYNLNPDSKNPQIDSKFPMEASSINKTNIPNEWISLKKINSSYSLMKASLNVTDIVQGGLQSCFFYSALASLLNYPKGEEYIKNAFSYYNESNSIYVTRWFLFGRFVYVSVDDTVPGNQTTGMPFFAQISKNGAFWAAILEKSWAKIWGNYESILFTSETVLLSALTGVLMKQYINVFDIDFIPSLLIKNLLTYPLWTLKSLTTANKIIPDHSFAVLGIYTVWLPGAKLVTLFHLYNPWGVDIDKNDWNDANPHLHSEEVKKQIPVAIEYANDGKFFYSLDDVVLNFERAIGISPTIQYEPYSFEIPLTDAIEQTISIKFKANFLQLSYIYFDLLNDDLFKYQIQPYEIKEIYILPLTIPFKTDINQSNNKLSFFTDFESFIYKGLLSWFPIPSPFYTLNIKIRKFNHDIIDKFFIVFYTNKDAIQILTKIESKQECENGCSNQGKCVNNTCICDENFYGKTCSLNNKTIYPSVKCSSCSENGYCLSTGNCKCFPGFDSSNNCSQCRDTSFLCKIPINYCKVKICNAKCLYGDCYIPGAQTACEVNKCYGNGFCSRYTGTCFNCRPGYSGQFCEVKNA